MEADNAKAVGNAAKLRKAIIAIKEINDMRPHDAKGYEINDIITEALAAPARNCDVFKTEFERRAAFIAYYTKVWRYAIDFCDLEHDLDGILHDYIKWLFDAAESKTKEGNDGGKPKTCGYCQTWKRDGKTCVGTCPHQDGMTAEWMSGCPKWS